MTFLEKLKEDQPKSSIPNDANGIGCPKDYGYECGQPFCKGYGAGKTCTNCWNREMPNTEPKVEVIPQAEVDAWHNAHESGKAEGYDQGLNDAWEFMSKLYSMTTDVAYKIFGTSCIEKIFIDYTPQEAIAKLKAYENSKIEVGDVVTYSGERGMVLDSIPSKFVVLTHDGWVQEWYECDVEKTGKHIALDGLLEQIGD